MAEEAKQLTVATQMAVQPVSESTAIINMIERASRDPAVDIDKLERLIALQERAKMQRSEEIFSVAMSAAQGAMGSIAADSNNPQTKSKYASYFALDKALRPIYTKHGFSLSFDTGEGAPENCVRVLCYVSNAGFTRTYRIDMPADGKGAKGGDVMTKTHAVGAASTYGQRYLLKMIFNIAVGEDKDGNSPASTAVISEPQADELMLIITDSGADVGKFCAFFKIDAVPDLPAAQFDEAVRRLREYEAKVKSEQGAKS